MVVERRAELGSAERKRKKKRKEPTDGEELIPPPIPLIVLDSMFEVSVPARVAECLIRVAISLLAEVFETGTTNELAASLLGIVFMHDSSRVETCFPLSGESNNRGSKCR